MGPFSALSPIKKIRDELFVFFNAAKRLNFSNLSSSERLVFFIFHVAVLACILLFSLFYRSTLMDSTGLNSTECGFDASDDFWPNNEDRHRGRLPSQMSSSGLGGGEIKNVNALFLSKAD